MPTTSTPTPSGTAGKPLSSVRRQPGTLRHLSLVIGVAFLLATLFTAWTPGPVEPGASTAPQAGFNLLLPPTALPEGLPTPTLRPDPLVGIVVGHWGDNHDPGAVCADGVLTELSVNQNVATRVKDILTERGLEVVLLKEFDPNLNGFKASALVSIHADSCDYVNAQATGYKVAAALANPHPERAARLTACLRSRYSLATGLSLHSTSITPDMTSYHAFGEIDENTPAAIIETGFLNLDRELLEKRPEVAAQGIADGIWCFINNEDITPATPPPAAEVQTVITDTINQ